MLLLLLRRRTRLGLLLPLLCVVHVTIEEPKGSSSCRACCLLCIRCRLRLLLLLLLFMLVLVKQLQEQRRNAQTDLLMST
jgi:hypothetical protein